MALVHKPKHSSPTDLFNLSLFCIGQSILWKMSSTSSPGKILFYVLTQTNERREKRSSPTHRAISGSLIYNFFISSFTCLSGCSFFSGHADVFNML